MTSRSASPPKTTPPKGRPTPRQRGGASRQTTPTSTKASSESATPASAEAKPRALLSRITGIALAVVAATVHVIGALYVTAFAQGDSAATMAAIAFAAMITIIFVPHARRHGFHRWLVVWGLGVVVQPAYLVPVLIAAETWILHRFWVVEGPARVPGALKAMFEKDSVTR